MENQLFAVDFQNDFTDPKGSLYVKGGEINAENTVKFIEKMGDKLDDISLTIDSHRVISIFHPIYWVDSKGNSPSPFTQVTLSDVEGKNPKWQPRNPAWKQRSIEYVTELEKRGRPTLTIWPEHCLLQSWGHGLYPPFLKAVQNWERKYFAMADYTVKGSNPFTENYGIFEAEVPDSADPTTALNTAMVEKLQRADNIYVVGLALSHCVATSVTQCANVFGNEHVKKFVLLEDCSSPVGDLPNSNMFKDMADKFVTDMVKRGMRVAKTTDF